MREAPDIILQGLTAGSERAKRLQEYFHDGSWAEARARADGDASCASVR